jgi:poly-gamma-glutamate capsule biosynthesis protein CapA/YwtB (metallophosphatase superfamily)
MRRFAAYLGALSLAACAPDSAVDDESAPHAAAFEPPSGPLVIAFAGDTMLGRGIDRMAADDPSFTFFRDLDPYLEDVEVLSLNLETTITTASEEWPGKNYHFKVHPERAPVLFEQLPRSASTQLVVSLANNHILDFFEPGLRETIDTLDTLAIPHAGAGEDLASAQAPVILTTPRGVRVGILSASSHCSCGSADGWRATEHAPGMWQFDPDTGDFEELRRAVTALRQTVDYVIVSLHWGPNWIETWPIDWMPELAGELVAAGASVIHGHSAHHVLPVQRIGGVPVLYGSGDFLDDYSARPPFRADLSYLARVHLQPNADTQVELVPLRIEHAEGHFVHPLDPSDPDYALVMTSADR